MFKASGAPFSLYKRAQTLHRFFSIIGPILGVPRKNSKVENKSHPTGYLWGHFGLQVYTHGHFRANFQGLNKENLLNI